MPERICAYSVADSSSWGSTPFHQARNRTRSEAGAQGSAASVSGSGPDAGGGSD